MGLLVGGFHDDWELLLWLLSLRVLETCGFWALEECVCGGGDGMEMLCFLIILLCMERKREMDIS